MAYDIPNWPYWCRFSIPKLYEEEVHLVELLTLRKVGTQLFKSTFRESDFTFLMTRAGT